MNHELFDLSGRVALVTGGSKGLGKAMARVFAEHGADVVISSRHDDELQAALKEIKEGLSIKAASFVADMTRRDDVQRLADAALKLYTTAPKPIVPLRQTREALGYDDTEIEAMEEEDEKEAERSPVAQLARAAGGGNANAE